MTLCLGINLYKSKNTRNVAKINSNSVKIDETVLKFLKPPKCSCTMFFKVSPNTSMVSPTTIKTINKTVSKSTLSLKYIYELCFLSFVL